MSGRMDTVDVVDLAVAQQALEIECELARIANDEFRISNVGRDSDVDAEVQGGVLVRTGEGSDCPVPHPKARGYNRSAGVTGRRALSVEFLLGSSDNFGRGRPVQLVFKSSPSEAIPPLIQASEATHFGASTTVPATACSVMQSDECKMQNGGKPKPNPNGRWG